MNTSALEEALRDLFLMADREGVTVDQLKRAIERLRTEYRNAGQRAAESIFDDY